MASCLVQLSACFEDICQDSALDPLTVAFSHRITLRDNSQDQSPAGRSRFVDDDTEAEVPTLVVESGNLDVSGCWTSCQLAANTDIRPLDGANPTTFYRITNRALVHASFPNGRVDLPDIDVVLDEVTTPGICGTTVNVNDHAVSQPPVPASNAPQQLKRVTLVAAVDPIDAGVAQAADDNGATVTTPGAGTFVSAYVFADTSALSTPVTAELVIDGVASGDTAVLAIGGGPALVRPAIVPVTTAIPATGGPHTIGVQLNGDGTGAENVTGLRLEVDVLQ